MCARVCDAVMNGAYASARETESEHCDVYYSTMIVLFVVNGDGTLQPVFGACMPYGFRIMCMHFG